MADVKISALPAATTPLGGTELVPIVQGGVTTRVSVDNLTAGRTVEASTVEASTVNVTANTGAGTSAVRITQIGAGNALLVEDSASTDATPFVIDPAGRVVIGTTTAVTLAGSTPTLQEHSTVGTQAAIAGWGTVSTQVPVLGFYRSASGTVGTQGVVSSGFDLGAVNFFGDDGTAFIPSAQILAEVDGTPGQTAGTFTIGLSYRILSIGTTDFTLIGAASNTVGVTFTATGAGTGTGTAILTTGDMPGRLTFSTTADGASTLTERMRIDNTGAVGIGTTTLGALYGLRVTKTLIGSTGTNIFSSAVGSSGITTNLFSIRSSVSTVTNSGTPYTISVIAGYVAEQGTFDADSTVTNQYGFDASSSLIGATNNFGYRSNLPSGTGRWNFYAAGTANNAYNGNSRFGGLTVPVATVDVTGSVAATTTILSTGETSGIGYATGAGGAVTQGTSRTTGVTLNTVSGAITLFSAAGLATYQSFTVTNSAVAATDTIILNQKSGTDRYILLVTDVAAGSFEITFATTGGTTTEQPVFNFAVIKAVAA